MTHPQQQLIANWRNFENGGTAWDDGYESALLKCAFQLEAALSAGAVPQQEPQEQLAYHLTDVLALRWGVNRNGTDQADDAACVRSFLESRLPPAVPALPAPQEQDRK